VIFVGDGAPWIWNRVQLLLDDLSLDPEQVFQVADYFHAAAHLWSLLELRKDLTSEDSVSLACLQAVRCGKAFYGTVTSQA
jgi:hypothetical protein